MEQIVDSRVLGGGLQDFLPEHSSSSSSHDPARVHEALDGPGEGVFRTSPQIKKSAGVAPHSGSELATDSSSSTRRAYDVAMAVEKEAEEAKMLEDVRVTEKLIAEAKDRRMQRIQVKVRDNLPLTSAEREQWRRWGWHRAKLPQAASLVPLLPVGGFAREILLVLCSLFVHRPEMLCIMAGTHQKDSCPRRTGNWTVWEMTSSCFRMQRNAWTSVLHAVRTAHVSGSHVFQVRQWICRFQLFTWFNTGYMLTSCSTLTRCSMSLLC